MVKGAPDWSKIIFIRALDVDGNLHDVRVDAHGRLVMIPYGYDGTDYLPLRVDDSGHLIAIMTGSDGEDLQIILTDDEGRMIGVIRDPDNDNYLKIDTDGFGTMVVKGHDGAALQTLKVDDAGNLLMRIYDPVTGQTLDIDASGNAQMVIKGTHGDDIRILAVDDDGRIIAVFRDPVSDNYAAISKDGFLSAILRGGSDIRLGCLLWYRFRASEGSVIQDYSGNAKSGAFLVGGAPGSKYADGISGESALLDGTNSYILVGDDSDFDFTAGDFTFEFWLKIDTLAADQYLFTRGASNVDGYYFVMRSAGSFRFSTNQAADRQLSTTSESYVVDTWYHVVVTRTGTTVKIYVDGVDDTDDPASHTDPLTSARDFYIGCYDGAASPMTGKLDEFRVYDRCLSAEEVLWRYRRTHVSLDDRYRPLSVDPEGRLEVSIADFAYKDQVLERGSTVYGGGGNQNEQSAVVPAGKMWVITAATAHSNGSACTSIDIGIYDGVDNFIIASDLRGADVFQVNYQGQLIMKPGDRLNFAWGHAATAYTTDWTLNGFELDYPY